MPGYARVTLTDLKNRLSEKVGNNTTFWTDGEKKDAINEALSIWQLVTGEFNKTFTLSVVSGTVYYDIPKQIASALRVSYSGTPLTLISLSELDYGFVGWQGTTGTPTYWTPVGLNKFAVYPQPTSGTLRIEGYAEAVRLNADGDFLQVGDEELTRLLDYAHHYLTIKEGTSELEASTPAVQRFFTAGALRNARITATTFFRRIMGQLRDEGEREPRSPFVGGVRETAQ